MLIAVVGVDQDALQVNNHQDIHVVARRFVDAGLEGCKGICKSEEHFEVLEMGAAGVQSYLPFVSFANANPVVGVGHVQVGEEFCTGQWADSLVDQR